MSQVCQRRADLVQKAGARPHLHQRGPAQRFERAHILFDAPDTSTSRVRCALALGHHAHARGAVLRHRQAALHVVFIAQRSPDDRAIALVDPVLAKGPAQALPGGCRRGDQQDTGCVDVQPVHHTAAQTRLAHALHLGAARRERVQQRPSLALAQGVHGHSRWLVECQPTGAARQHVERQLGLGDYRCVCGRRDFLHDQPIARRHGVALVRQPGHTPVQRDGPAGQELARLAPRNAQQQRERPVEPALRKLVRHRDLAGRTLRRNPCLRPRHPAILQPARPLGGRQAPIRRCKLPRDGAR